MNGYTPPTQYQNMNYKERAAVQAMNMEESKAHYLAEPYVLTQDMIDERVHELVMLYGNDPTTWDQMYVELEDDDYTEWMRDTQELRHG